MLERLKTGRRSGLVHRLVAAAAVLGASAYVTHRMVRKTQAENPPRGRFVVVDGVRLHYLEYGSPSNPPLVLLHGNGVMAQEMEISGLVDTAVRDYHVIAFDRPGFGHSERSGARRYDARTQAQLLLRALHQLGVFRPIVLGHSWGSMVAFWMALEEPSAVRALVLAGGYYTPSLRLDTLWLGAPAIPLLGTLMRHTISPLLGRLLWPLSTRRMFAPARVSEAFKQYPAWMTLRPGEFRASSVEGATMIVEALKLKRREHELNVPTVIVAGKQDLLVMTWWQSQRLNRRVPATKLHLVPGAGHMVHHTATDAVMEAIDEAARLSSSNRAQLAEVVASGATP